MLFNSKKLAELQKLLYLYGIGDDKRIYLDDCSVFMDNNTLVFINIDGIDKSLFHSHSKIIDDIYDKVLKLEQEYLC